MSAVSAIEPQQARRNPQAALPSTVVAAPVPLPTTQQRQQLQVQQQQQQPQLQPQQLQSQQPQQKMGRPLGMHKRHDSNTSVNSQLSDRSGGILQQLPHPDDIERVSSPCGEADVAAAVEVEDEAAAAANAEDQGNDEMLLLSVLKRTQSMDDESRKIALLKRALVEERQARVLQREKFVACLKKLERFQGLIQEKDYEVSKLKNDVEVLQSKVTALKSEHTIVPKLIDSQKNKGGFLSGNARNSKNITEQFQQLSLQLSSYKETIADLEVKIRAREKEILELKSSESIKTQLIEDKVQRHKELIERFNVMDEENKKLSEENKMFRKDMRALELDVKLWQTRTREKHHEVEEQQVTLNSRNNTIQLKDKELAEKEQVIEKLSEKLLQTKHQLEMVNLQLRKFPVKIVKLLTKTEGQLILQKNPSNSLLTLCVQPHGGKAQAWPLDSIVDIRADKQDQRKFVIIYANNHSETYESEVRDDIIAALRDFMKALYSEDMNKEK